MQYLKTLQLCFNILLRTWSCLQVKLNNQQFDTIFITRPLYLPYTSHTINIVYTWWHFKTWHSNIINYLPSFCFFFWLKWTSCTSHSDDTVDERWQPASNSPTGWHQTIKIIWISRGVCDRSCHGWASWATTWIGPKHQISRGAFSNYFTVLFFSPPI